MIQRFQPNSYSFYVWETTKIGIKEQLKQENQRKLFDKLLFKTICPEFNNGGVIKAVSIVLFKFL